MTVGENRIRNLTNEEKQIIYDALVHYTFSESDMGKSNHFAADVHAEIAKKAGEMTVQIRRAWENDITH